MTAIISHPSNDQREPLAQVMETTLAILRAILPDSQGLSADSSLSERRLSSLLAVRLRLELQRRLSVDVSMQELSECESPARLAQLVAQRRSTLAVPKPGSIAPSLSSGSDRAAPFALTDIQQAYAIGKQSSPADDAMGCHLYREIEVEQLDLARLRAAFQRLTEHFEVLRLELTADGRQRVRAHCDWDMLVHATDSSDGGASDATVERVRADCSRRAFKSDEWPLFRVAVSHASAGTSVVHLSVDGALCDGVGLNLLLDTWRALYDDSRALLPEPCSLRSAVAALSARQTSAEYQRDLAYWVERLDGCPDGPQLIDRMSGSNGSSQQLRWRSISGGLDAAEWARFRERAAVLGVSATSLALTVFIETLGRASAPDPFSLVLTTNFRPWLPLEASTLVGPFTGTMIFRAEAAPSRTLDDNARGVHQSLWRDLDHGSVGSIAALRELRRHKKAVPKELPVVFTSLIDAHEATAANTHQSQWRVSRAASQTSGVRLDHQMWEQDSALHVQWDVTDGWLTPGAIDALASLFFRGLRAAASSAAEQLLPLNELQKAYFVPRASEHAPGHDGCQVYFSFIVPKLSVARLEQALLRLIAAYDVLRTVIGSDGMAHVRADTPSRFEIPVIELGADADRDAALNALCSDMVTRAYPLDRFPMFDVRVTRDAEGEHRVHLSIDLAIADGISLHLIARELLRLAVAQDSELAAREAEPMESAALRTSSNAREYWQRRFAHMPPGPAVRRQTARKQRIRLQGSLDAWPALKAAAKARGLSPDMLLAAALGAALQASYPDQPFSMPVVQWLPDVTKYRPRELTALSWVTDSGVKQPLLERAAAYHAQLAQDPPASAGSGLAELRKCVMQNRRRGDFALPVVYTSILDLSEFPLPNGVRIGPWMTYTPDVSLDCISVEEHDGTLHLYWDAIEADFEPGQLHRMFAAYENALREPALALSASQDTIVRAWNDTARPFPDTRPAHHYFEDRARDRPQALALDGSEGPLSYGQLNEHANRIAWHLKSLGVGPETVVGIHIGRGHAMVAAVLGVLKAGGAYLPLDLAWPVERLKTVLSEAQAQLILTEPASHERALAAGVKRAVALERDLRRVFPDQRSDDPPPSAGVDDTAYIIFTSGSTGTPKGISVAHRSLLNLLSWAYRTFDFGPADKGLAVAALGFDLSVFDVFGLLGCGASLYIASEEQQKDPALLLELLLEQGITFWNSAPAVLQQMAPQFPEALASEPANALRLVFLSGDYTPLSLPGALRASFPNACVVNLGGATEATVWSNYYIVGEIDPSWRSIPYGKPIDNCRYYVLDESLAPCPVGSEGDLYIAGAALSRGYVNRPELTAKSFIPDPFAKSSRELMYKTGDRASYYPDGNLNFLGRTDQQVKIRGFRVELAEIEHRLRAFPAISEALVLVRLDRSGDQKVVAYVICAARPCPTAKAVRAHAAEALPAYMVPNHIVFLDEFPKTANGKLDREALPWPVTETKAAAPESRNPSREEIAEVVGQLCAAALSRSAVEHEQDLWDLGATSFDMVQVSNALQRHFGCRVPVAALVEDATVASIARFLDKQLAAAAVPSAALVEPQKPAPPPAAAPSAALTVAVTVDLFDPASVSQFKAKSLHLRRRASEPVVFLQSARPTAEQAAARASHRRFASGPLTLDQLAALLGKLSTAPGALDSKRLYPSAGSTYGVQVYVHAKPGGVEGLAAGIHYYHPDEHSLTRISDGRSLQRGVHFQYNRTIFDASALELYLVGQTQAIAPLYGEDAEKFLLIEAGYIGQLLMMAQGELGVSLCPVGSLAFAKVRDDFALDAGHRFLHAFFVGPALTTASSSALAVQPKSSTDEVAIIGVAGRYPGADTPRSLWRTLSAGQRAISRPPAARRTSLAVDEGSTLVGGFLEDIAAFDSLLFHVSPREAKELDPQTRLSLEVAWECLEDAGYTPESLRACGRVGVFAAVMWHDYQQRGADVWAAGGNGTVAGMASDLANRLSYVFGFEGPSLAINTSCSSSLSALHAARSSLQNGECDVALVVAVNLVTHPYHLGLLARHGLLSSSATPLAFDSASQGWLPGEGCGALLLRPASTARSQDDLRAILESTWVGHSGRAPRFAAPNSEAMARSIRGALAAARVTPDDIDYVECAAAGASLADTAEIEALEAVFASAGRDAVPIGTLKPNIGHLEAASGMSQLTKVLLQLRARRFAPTLVSGSDRCLVAWQSTGIRPVEHAAPWLPRRADAPRRALVNSAGATGSFAHAVVREATPPVRSASQELAARYVLLSAASSEQLAEYGARMLRFLKDAAAEQSLPRLDDIAFTCQVGRVAMSHRLLITCRDTAQLMSALEGFVSSGKHPAVQLNDVDSSAQDRVAPASVEQAALSWLQGLEIDWEHFWDGVARRTALPTLPFARERHWLNEARSPALPAPVDPVDPTRRGRVEHTLLELYAELSGIPSSKLRTNTPLDRYGLNSTLIGELNQRLAQQFGPLPSTLFFEHRDLASIASFLAGRSGSTESAPAPATAAKESQQDQRIAIVGIAGRYPGARDLHELWKQLSEGRDQIRQLPESRRRPGWPVERMWGSFLDEVDRFDPLFFKISPRDAQLMSPEERLFLEVAWETIESAGYGRRRLREQHASRCGVFVGAMYNEYPFFAVEQALGGRSGYAGSAPAGIANRVSYFLDLHGPSLVVDTMCSASLTALHLAVQSLLRGECELALAGGVNLCLHPNKFIQIDGLKMSSSDHRCRAFGAGGSGFVPGEGVGALLLKPLDRALADGDRIHAVVLATAINHGGKTNGYMVPSPSAQSDVVLAALRRAGVDSTSIGYVEAHGTGTELGDPIELEGLSRAFAAAGGAADAADAGRCAIGSIKSLLGHLEAAAGIAGVTKVVQQMQARSFAPSLHADVLNPNIDWARSPFRVQRTTGPWPAIVDAHGTPLPRRACVSAFGAGGSNAHVVLEAFEEPPRAAPARPSPELFVLSARDSSRLAAMANRLAKALREPAAAYALDELSHTLQVGRDAFRERLAIVATSHDELADALERFARAEAGPAIHGRASESSPAQTAPSDLQALAHYWVAGGEVNWLARRSGRAPKMIGLPSYPFAEMRCWLPENADQPEANRSALEPTPGVAWYEKDWRIVEQAPARPVQLTGSALCVFGAASAEIAQAVARALGERNVMLVREGAPLPPGFAEAVTWIDLCDVQRAPGEPDLWQARVATLQQWLSLRGTQPRRVLHLTRASLPESPRAHLLAGCHMAGVIRLLESEVRQLSAHTVETDLSAQRPAAIADQILAELASEDSPGEVRYRAGRRYVPELRLLAEPPAAAPALDPSAAYLVSGGTRGLGALVARHLVERGARKLALVATSPVPVERGAWDDQALPDAAKSAIATVRELERRGAQVMLHCGSIADDGALSQFLDEVRSAWGRVAGVVHCAGRSSAGSPAFVRKSRSELGATFEPKLSGLDVLAANCQRDEPDFIIAFSSVSALVPALAAGVLDYAAANASMEIYAERLRAAGMPRVCTVAWPPWSESAVSSAALAACARVGLDALDTGSALAALDRLLSTRSAKTLLVVRDAVSNRDVSGLLQTGRGSAPKLSASSARPPQTSKPAVLEWLVDLFGSELAIPTEDLDPSATFTDLGVESVMLAELVRKIEARVGRAISPSILLEHPTLERLSARLLQDGDALTAVSEPSSRALPEVSELRSAKRRSSSPHVPDNAIAVLGASARFPGADTLDDFWSNLVGGRCGVSEVPPERWDSRKLYHPQYRMGASTSKWGGFVERLADFDFRYFEMSRDEATRSDPAIRLFLEGVACSLADAGYARAELRGSQTSVFVGARMSSYRRRIPSTPGAAPLGGDQNFIAARVAHFFDWHGPNLVVDSACSSALVAVKLACQSLLDGESTLAVAGGVEVLLDEEPYVEFSAARALSPSGRCKAFDHSADGFVPGEGCGVVLLKPLQAALRDGDRIRAVIRAVAVNNDGATMGLTTPNPAAQTDVVRRALRECGVSADAVEMLEAHGTATMIGDPIELQALTTAFREATSRAGFCALGSVKSNVGHLLTAAGIAGLLKVILAVEHGRIPPTLFCDRPNPRFDFDASPFFPNTSLREWPAAPGARIAGVSAFGLGGTNAHAIVSGLDPELRGAGLAIRAQLAAPEFERSRCWLDAPAARATAHSTPEPVVHETVVSLVRESDASILDLEFVA